MPRKEHWEALVAKLSLKQAHIAVIGLGYVGLPLATAIADAGHRVIGIDRAEGKINSLRDGFSYIGDVPSADIQRLVSEGRLAATTDVAETARADVVVIAVPTPIDEYRIPDLSYVRDAAAGVATYARRGSLIVLESTSYPGTTNEVLVTALRSRGFNPGQDVFVGYSPERIDPGNQQWGVINTPKLVAGLTPQCLAAVDLFYASFVKTVVPVSSLETAEISKLFENIFRIVNIALVNEFQIICDSFGIDVWEVIKACSTKPYGFMPFYPGPGLGGHCVPVDPFYLAWKAREKQVNTEFIELAGRINAAVPNYVLGKVRNLLNGQGKSLKGSRIALLGVAYKKNVADVRESPSIRLVELLEAEGSSVSYHDPHVPVIAIGDNELRSQALTDEYLRAHDAAVIVADHDAIDWSLVASYRTKVVDTRNVLSRVLAPHRIPSPVRE